MMPFADSSAELKRVLNRVTSLRPLTTEMAHLLRAAGDPGFTTGELAGLVAQISPLAEILPQVTRTITDGPSASLTDAVDSLGRKQVYFLALGLAAAGKPYHSLSGYRLRDGELWAHSLGVAKAARYLAQVLAYPAPEEAGLGGLLHDLGKLLLDPFISENYHWIVDSLWKRKLHLWQAEEQLLGINHAAAGGLVAAGWGFPPDLVDAIRYHHNPAQAANQPELAAIVSLADAITPLASLGLSALDWRQVHPEAIALLGLDLTTVEGMRATLWHEQVGKRPAEAHPAYTTVIIET